MPIATEILEPSGIVRTVLSGHVTDAELLAHYRGSLVQEVDGPWREIVDGSGITTMAVTPDGQRKLAEVVGQHRGRLRDARVAMVAGSDVTFGMFRMWQLQRESLGYDVRVFRNLDDAMAWVSSGS